MAQDLTGWASQSRRRGALRARILAEDGGQLVCWLCRLPILSGQPWDLDHAIARSVAPWLAWEPRNLRPAHARCNRRRGAKSPDFMHVTTELVDSAELSPRWARP